MWDEEEGEVAAEALKRVGKGSEPKIYIQHTIHSKYTLLLVKHTVNRL